MLRDRTNIKIVIGMIAVLAFVVLTAEGGTDGSTWAVTTWL